MPARSISFPWTRYWYERRPGPTPWGSGYLPDPDGPIGKYVEPHPVPLANLLATPCLVLLGDVGVGKSRVLEASRPDITAAIAAGGDRAFFLNLGEYGDERLLIDDLMAPDALGGWDPSIQRLHLFLDSLDECQVRIGQLTALLSSRLRRFPSDRLHVRIVCRSSDWPSGFEERLRSHWGSEQVRVYELAPLRIGDVELAARMRGLDPAVFLREVDRSDAVGFARAPLTLQFLLNEFAERRALSRSRRDLYLQGCRYLCQETPTRLEAHLTQRYPLDELLRTAGRIAAATVFCGAPIVCDDALTTDRDANEAHTRDLVGDNSSDQAVSVTPADLLTATLRTGLFSPRGSERYIWSHHSYAEFLAAWYAVEQQIEPAQARDLVIHPDAHVIPQLRETAAWMATMDQAAFATVVAADPDVVLGADLASLPEQDRATAAEALLRAYDSDTPLSNSSPVGAEYAVLDHPGLSDQVRPFLVDYARNERVRTVAVDIAWACRLTAVQEELLRIALDSSEQLRLRMHAVLALADVGDRDTRQALRSLLEPQPDEDADDELRGALIRALWPDVLSAAELFATLRPPRNRGFFGSYFATLHGHVLPHLREEDLPVALQWVSTLGVENAPRDAVGDLAQEIMVLAFGHVDDAEVSEGLVRVILRRSAHTAFGHEPFGSEIQTMITADERRRHILAKAVFDGLPNPNADHHRLWGWHPRLVLSSDVPWIISELERESDPSRQTALAEMIARVWDRTPEQASQIWEAAQTLPALAAEFDDLLNGIPIASERAKHMREYQQRTGGETRTLLDPPPHERVASALDRFDKGDRGAFWADLMRDLTLRPDSTHYYSHDVLEPDLAKLPGWEEADAELRMRIVGAAFRYVSETSNSQTLRSSPETYELAAVAGYKALRLLAQHAPERLTELSQTSWGHWAAVIVDYPGPYSQNAREPDEDVATAAFRAAPEAVINALLLRIDEENIRESSWFALWRFRHVADHRLAEAVAEKSLEPQITPKTFGELLDFVFQIAPDIATPIAEHQLAVPLPDDPLLRERSILAAVQLALHANERWPVLWQAIQADPEFGREVIGRIAEGTPGHGRGLANGLDDAQLGLLYLWIEQNVPPAAPMQFGVVRTMGRRDLVDMLHNEVLGQLRDRGTAQACDAIGMLIQRLPHQSFLRGVLAAAQTNYRIRSWLPPTPRQVLALLAKREIRFVQSTQQLLEVLESSLLRFQAELQGKPPSAQFLWNKSQQGWRPKDEESLSDFLKLHLERDIRSRGIVANREVQLRRGIATAPGEKTDILVDAVPLGAADDVIGVVIEVKGCWNPELLTAMETQLVGRYMNEFPGRAGLYVVGWYDCPVWSRTKGNKCSHEGFDELERVLEDQAKRLSDNDRRVSARLLDARIN